MKVGASMAAANMEDLESQCKYASYEDYPGRSGTLSRRRWRTLTWLSVVSILGLCGVIASHGLIPQSGLRLTFLSGFSKCPYMAHPLSSQFPNAWYHEKTKCVQRG